MSHLTRCNKYLLNYQVITFIDVIIDSLKSKLHNDHFKSITSDINDVSLYSNLFPRLGYLLWDAN